MDQFQRDSVAFFSRLEKASRRCSESVLSGKPKCHFFMLHRVAAAICTAGCDGSIPVSELSKHFYDSPQGVSRGLRILEQDGLVERIPDPSDRRKMLVRLTRQGEDAHEACQSAMEEFGRAVAARMGSERLRRMQEDYHALLEAMEAEALRLEQCGEE